MKKYTILKNWHYAFFLFGRICGWHYNKKIFKIKFKFSDECYWSPPKNDDDNDLNKLFGISFGLFSLHKNSVRLTWVPKFDQNNMIEIYGYIYDSTETKKFRSQFICIVETSKEYESIIECFENQYIFTVNGKSISMENFEKDKKIQKEVYPFFGGNNTAIRTMDIYAGLEVVQ